MLDPIYHDLVGLRQTDNGRTGMTAEQVLRCAILKQYRNLSYEELAFHLSDSVTFRTFARLERRQRPSASTLQENIKSLGEETWEAVNRAIIARAAETGIEKGRTVHIDSTAVERDVHYPTDSTLLQDGIRVITRLLMGVRRFSPPPAIVFATTGAWSKNEFSRSKTAGKKRFARLATKIVSFFECHADIIEKGNRETTYSHKIFLTGGRSGLIPGCLIERGNPADTSI